VGPTDHQPPFDDDEKDGGLGQTLLVGFLILVFLLAVAGLLLLTVQN
jgi:hypothetical protein